MRTAQITFKINGLLTEPKAAAMTPVFLPPIFFSQEIEDPNQERFTRVEPIRSIAIEVKPGNKRNKRI